MTKDMGFDYDPPAKTQTKRGGKLVSYVFDALFPFILICLAFSASRHFFS